MKRGHNKQGKSHSPKTNHPWKFKPKMGLIEWGSEESESVWGVIDGLHNGLQAIRSGKKLNKFRNRKNQ